MARILIIGINYAPESIGAGKYTSEMAAWLAAKGHVVRVVTAPPYYPAWRVAVGYRRWWWSREIIEGVEVVRCPLWVPAKPRGLSRIVHLVSFGISSLPPLIGSKAFQPHLVINIAPSLTSAPGALLAAKLSKAQSWLHVQDFELDAALDMGIVEAGPARQLAIGAERLIMRAFSRVSTISEKMLKRLVAKGVDADACVFLPNWADIDSIRPLDTPSPYRAELGIPDDALVALYSGNMGLKQGLELLGEIAHATADEATLHYVFAGQGPGREALQESCRGLSNVHFLDLQPIERLNDWLGLADIHLLPQRADVADLVMPSKLTGMLASGRPVVATAMLGTGVANALQTSGISVPPGSSAGMVQALLSLASAPETRRKMGQAARMQAESSLARDAILGRLNCEIQLLLAHGAPGKFSTDTDQV